MGRFCFLAERQVGIGSAAGAIEPYVRARPNVEWTDVTYAKDGGWIERLPLPGRTGGVLRGVQQTTSALRRGQFDALFFLTHNPAVLQQRAVARTPTVLWTDVTPALLDEQAAQYGHPVDSFGPIRQLKHALVRRTFQNARLCIAWSEWARRSIAKAYDVPNERTMVVAPGVDLTRFENKDALKPGLPRLLFVGGNFARKGGDLLLDVFEQHFKGRYELDIVTRDQIAERPGVSVYRRLNAASPELLALYDAATAFVLPTRGDCFSIASLEAMAKSLPVLVSAVGGIPEIVEHGSSGWLLGSDAGTDLKAALEALLIDASRARQMGARGREIVTLRFNAQQTAARLLSLVAQSAGVAAD